MIRTEEEEIAIFSADHVRGLEVRVGRRLHENIDEVGLALNKCAADFIWDLRQDKAASLNTKAKAAGRVSAVAQDLISLASDPLIGPGGLRAFAAVEVSGDGQAELQHVLAEIERLRRWAQGASQKWAREHQLEKGRIRTRALADFLRLAENVYLWAFRDLPARSYNNGAVDGPWPRFLAEVYALIRVHSPDLVKPRSNAALVQAWRREGVAKAEVSGLAAAMDKLGK